jgi:hypothetical protein
MTNTAQATATVTITDEMIEAGAEAMWLHRGFGRLHPSFSGRPISIRESYKGDARAAIEAALAAPPPAPSDSLERAIATCIARYPRSDLSLYRAWRVRDVFQWQARVSSDFVNARSEWVDTPEEALLTALAAASGKPAQAKEE